jgi:aminoglycoside phosphotransferase (APT) family kinase protein
MQPWESAQPVDAARAAELVGGQFPSLRGAPVRAVATGWDNSVLLVGEVLFRFPRREIALDGQRRELAVLPLLRGLPLPVPVPTHLGEPAGDYPWPFWGAPMVPGRELGLVPGADRRAAAEATGDFLRALHDLQVDVELPHDPMGRGTPARRLERARPWLVSLEERGLWTPSAEATALLESPLVPPPGEQVLVHGDLHARHLLVADDGRPTGVIDWGDTCFADASVDLSLAYAAFDGRDRAALLAAYGPVPAETEVRARALALGLCAALADWASSVGEPQLLAEYLAGLHRALDLTPTP